VTAILGRGVMIFWSSQGRILISSLGLAIDFVSLAMTDATRLNDHSRALRSCIEVIVWKVSGMMSRPRSTCCSELAGVKDIVGYDMILE